MIPGKPNEEALWSKAPEQLDRIFPRSRFNFQSQNQIKVVWTGGREKLFHTNASLFILIYYLYLDVCFSWVPQTSTNAAACFAASFLFFLLHPAKQIKAASIKRKKILNIQAEVGSWSRFKTATWCGQYLRWTAVNCWTPRGLKGPQGFKVGSAF